MMIASQKTKSRHNTVQGACQILSSGSHASWRSIKECHRCKQVKSILEFDKNHPSKDGHINICKTCKSKYNRKYKQTEQGKTAHRRYNQSEKGKARYRRYYIRHSDQIRAKNAVNHAIRAGKLHRPDILFCKYCYEKAVHYRHPDYSKLLDVIPLCRKCHRKIHSVPAPTAAYKRRIKWNYELKQNRGN